MRLTPLKHCPRKPEYKNRNGCALCHCQAPDRTAHTSTPIPPPTIVPKAQGIKYSDSLLWTGRGLQKDRTGNENITVREAQASGLNCTSFQAKKSREGMTHRRHRQAAVPAEKGVRHGHTEALSGTAVLGGEGHFSLLDTVGDREGRSSIGGLLGRGRKRRQGGGESREWSASAV